MLTTTAAARLLRAHNACAEARTWFDQQPDIAAAWRTCDRADWMLWLCDEVLHPQYKRPPITRDQWARVLYHSFALVLDDVKCPTHLWSILLTRFQSVLYQTTTQADAPWFRGAAATLTAQNQDVLAEIVHRMAIVTGDAHTFGTHEHRSTWTAIDAILYYTRDIRPCTDPLSWSVDKRYANIVRAHIDVPALLAEVTDAS